MRWKDVLFHFITKGYSIFQAGYNYYSLSLVNDGLNFDYCQVHPLNTMFQDYFAVNNSLISLGFGGEYVIGTTLAFSTRRRAASRRYTTPFHPNSPVVRLLRL